MQKIKRGYRYQVSDPRRGTESGAATMGLIWLVLDTHSGEDKYPIVASETSRAKARKIAYNMNQSEWLKGLERKEKERAQKHPIP